MGTMLVDDTSLRAHTDVHSSATGFHAKRCAPVGGAYIGPIAATPRILFAVAIS